MIKRVYLFALAAAAGALPVAAAAEVSANVGWVSKYIFRGTFQEDASAFAGIDYSGDGGSYAGAWAADVGDGLETDLYFGYRGGGDWTYKVGYTGYFYTEDFDDTYHELNLGLGHGILALDVAVGRWDGFGDPQDYVFSSLTIEPERMPYLRIGSFGRDFDGDYLELGYVWAIEPHALSLSLALTASDDLNVTGSGGGSGDYALVFGVKKAFGIRD